MRGKHLLACPEIIPTLYGTGYPSKGGQGLAFARAAGTSQKHNRIFYIGKKTKNENEKMTHKYNKKSRGEWKEAFSAATERNYSKKNVKVTCTTDALKYCLKYNENFRIRASAEGPSRKPTPA